MNQLIKKKAAGIIYSKYKDFQSAVENMFKNDRSDLEEKIKNMIKELQDKIINDSQELTFTKGFYKELVDEAFDSIRGEINIEIPSYLYVIHELENAEGDIFSWLDSMFTSRSGSREEVLKKFRHNLDKLEKDIKSHIQKRFNSLRIQLLTFKDKIELQVMKPVEDSILNARNNINNKEQRLKEIDDEISKLDAKRPIFEQKIRELEDKIKNYKIALSEV